jgi:Adenosine deaminase
VFSGYLGALFEVATAPFCSEESFSLGGNHPDWQSPELIPTLWKASEARLCSFWPEATLDPILKIRDHFWIASYSNRQGIQNLWKHISLQFLEPMGPSAHPRCCSLVPQNPLLRSQSKDARAHYRWLTFFAPDDSLLVGTWDSRNRPTSVRTISHELSQQLTLHGFAEPHVHLNAALTFSDLWISAMRGIGNTFLSRSSFHSPGGVFRNGEFLADWILRAAICRLVLAENLFFGPISLSNTLQNIVAHLQRRFGAGTARLFYECVQELMSGSLSSISNNVLDTNFSDLQNLYRHSIDRWWPYEKPFVLNSAIDNQNRLRQESLEKFRSLDPIGHWFPSKGAMTTEMQFQYACFTRLEQTASNPDEHFDAIFWQYFRIRNLLYRHIVHRPLTPGLTHFIRSYDRIWPSLAMMSERARLESAANTSGRNRGLRSLEVRTAPFVNSTNLATYAGVHKSTIADLTLPNSSLREIGFVLHFVRNRGPNTWRSTASPGGLDTFANPSLLGAGTGYRYGAIYKRFVSEASNLCQLIQGHPEILLVIRGIDACNDENAIPAWVVIPHMRRVVEESRTILSNLQGTPRLIGLQPLRTTVHVGEDYLHVQTGLRRIAEFMKHLPLAETDRMGHALALGIDIIDWCNRFPTCVMSIEERLWDLAWEHELFSNQSIATSATRIKFVEGEILRLGRSIIDQKATLSNILDLYQSVFDLTALTIAGFPDGNGRARPRSSKKNTSLLAKYLTSPKVFAQGQIAIAVDTALERDHLLELQEYLRHQVMLNRIVVEINPSSNLLVGRLGDLKTHPMMKLIRIGERLKGNGIPIVIGTDDPVCFSTDLPNEYELILDALAECGVDSSACSQFLMACQNTSMTSRFTI